ncbi:MAG: HD domain-containing protein [Chloroflexi bacterium]|nr:HD domain-containing protein [Chloroflexota bacterium]
MTDFVAAVAGAMAARGLEAHVVGGAVRDRLLGRPPRDVDVIVASDANPVCREIAVEIDATCIVMDEARGYMRLAPHHGQRADGSGVRWVDVNSRAGTLAEDLRRRDFTVNAMAVPLGAWEAAGAPLEVVDPAGGRSDLVQKLVRQVSAGAMDDDPLRAVRACRLAAQLGFEIEPATSQAVVSHARAVAGIAPERLREELFAIIGGDHALRGVRLLDSHGLLELLLPEVCRGKGVVQPREHYWDVFEHSVQTVGEVEKILDPSMRLSDPIVERVPWQPQMTEYFAEVVADDQSRGSLLKLAALFHDVAKPETRTVQPDGRTRFFGHADRGAEIVEDALRRLRASRRTIAHVSLMVKEHLRPVQLSDGVRPPTPRALLRYYRDVAPVAIDTVYLAIADYLAARGPRIEESDWQRHSDRLGDILRRGFEEQRESKPSLLFDGHQIQRLFGLPPGPEIGRLLGVLRDAEAAGKVQTQEEALDLLRVAVREGGGPGRSSG